MKKFKIIIFIFLILIITLNSFYPSVKNNFVNWDDNLYVTENSVIRSISLANLKNIFTSFFISHYQPVTIFSYLLEYHFFKLNPFNYHLTNLLLHLLNCLLVFWVIYMLTGRISISCLTALFFGIHPMQVESVAWISERKNLLYAFFYLGAMISYLYYLKKEKALKYYLLCLGLFILSLLSKSMAITLPLVFLVLDYFTSRKIKPAVFIEKIPYFFLSLLFGLVALFSGHSSQTDYTVNVYGLFTRLKGISGDIVFYLSKLCFPIKLSALYPYVEIKNNPFYLYCFVAVIILLIAIIISIRYTKKVILGSGLFLMMVFPVIRFIPQEEVLVADRYIYLPAIGIFYLLAEGFIWLYHRKTVYYRFIRIFLVSGLALVIILLSFLTWERNFIWKDSLSLWNDILKKYPDTAIAYNNRGEYFSSQGEYEKAHFDFMKATGISSRYPFKPSYKYYCLNLGNSLRALGRNSEAIAIFEKLVREGQPKFGPGKTDSLLGNQDEVIAVNKKTIEAEAYFNLANINDALGEKDKAIALYSRTIEIYPKSVNARYYLSILYVKLNRQEEAKEELIKAIEIDPIYLSAYVQLAQIYKTLRQKEELILLYKKAITNNLDFFDAYYYIGNLYSDAQKDKDAILLYKKAIEINPYSKEICVGLGNSYLTIGRNKEAIIWLKKALELDPNLAVAHNNLALAYYYAEEYSLAIQHCDQASGLGYTISPKLLELLKPHRK